jgi:hypothetical protein
MSPTVSAALKYLAGAALFANLDWLVVYAQYADAKPVLLMSITAALGAIGVHVSSTLSNPTKP